MKRTQNSWIISNEMAMSQQDQFGKQLSYASI